MREMFSQANQTCSRSEISKIKTKICMLLLDMYAHSMYLAPAKFTLKILSTFIMYNETACTILLFFVVVHACMCTVLCVNTGKNAICDRESEKNLVLHTHSVCTVFV